MSSGRMELFWTFVDTGKFDKALKCIASDFQYDALSGNGVTLLVRATGAGLCETTAEQKKCLELIKALRAGGASWTQACRSKNSYSVWKMSDPENTKITVDYGSHSALSFAQGWLRQLHGKGGWELEECYLHQVVEIFLAEAQQSRTKVAIDEDIASKLRKSQILCVFLARFPHEHEKIKNRISHHWVCKAIPYPTWLIRRYSYRIHTAMN